MEFDFNSLLPKCIEISRRAGQIILDGWNKPHALQYKGPVDLVTETDIAVQAFLQMALRELLPEAAFLGEELQNGEIRSPNSGLLWIVDPVDGTTNFVHRIPMLATSIALVQDGEPLLGVVNAPALRQCFYAAKGGGAFCNQEELHVSTASHLVDCVAATGFPYDIKKQLPEILGRLEKVLPATQGLRRLGAASLDLAYVASGKLDIFYETGLKPWDVAAGIILTSEAGGVISDFNGCDYKFGAPILADNGIVHKDILNLLKDES